MFFSGHRFATTMSQTFATSSDRSPKHPQLNSRRQRNSRRAPRPCSVHDHPSRDAGPLGGAGPHAADNRPEGWLGARAPVGRPAHAVLCTEFVVGETGSTGEYVVANY